MRRERLEHAGFAWRHGLRQRPAVRDRPRAQWRRCLAGGQACPLVLMATSVWLAGCASPPRAVVQPPSQPKPPTAAAPAARSPFRAPAPDFLALPHSPAPSPRPAAAISAGWAARPTPSTRLRDPSAGPSSETAGPKDTSAAPGQARHEVRPSPASSSIPAAWPFKPTPPNTNEIRAGKLTVSGPLVEFLRPPHLVVPLDATPGPEPRFSLDYPGCLTLPCRSPSATLLSIGF